MKVNCIFDLIGSDLVKLITNILEQVNIWEIQLLKEAIIANKCITHMDTSSVIF